MPPFNPDQYLAQKVGFNPDAYLAGKGDYAPIPAPQRIPWESEAPYSGSVLPFTRKDGETSFDSDAGILGMFKRAVTAPGEVLKGELDPRSEEGMGRLLEAAAVMSPLPAASRAARGVYKLANPKPPSAEALNAAKQAGYKEAGESGVEFTGEATKAFADDLVAALNKEAVIAENIPKLFNYIKHLQNPAEGAAVTIPMLHAFRKRLGNMAGNQNDSELAFAASVAIRKLDEFMAAADSASVVVRTPATKGTQAFSRRGHDFHADDAAASQKTADRAIAAFNDAQGNAAALFRSNRVTGMEKTAARRTAAANSGRNTDNAIRQRLTSLVESAKGSRGLSKEEIAAIDDIIFGKPTKNAARMIGNLFGGGGGLGANFLSLLSGVGGASMAGAPGAALGYGIPMAIGQIGRTTANQMSKRELKKLDGLIRSRSPLADSLLTKAKPQYVPQSGSKEALLRALLYGTAQPNP
jgi:hypothetical protein